MNATVVFCLLAVCVLVCIALLREGDVNTSLKVPFLSFSLHARDRRGAAPRRK
jgi:hypothetical protein